VLDRAFAPWPVLASRVRDERGEIRRHVNVFVDGEDAKRAQGVATEVRTGSTVHVINAVSGG
jgi:molybdopterin converting factor small subunit